jgi:hypothetical protein
MHCKEIFSNVDRIKLIQDQIQRQTLVLEMMNLHILSWDI